jgi:adenylyltransferase/sulfurtransferase
MAWSLLISRRSTVSYNAVKLYRRQVPNPPSRADSWTARLEQPRVKRYHRQIILPQIGEAGQDRLAAARVLLIGAGALGSTIAEQLVRAGVGFLRLVDRDILELSNLQRQSLYDERHAATAWPKAAAASDRLAAINSTVAIDPHVTDAHCGNIESLAGLGRQPAGNPVQLILDGTDNVATRYLINDLAVKYGLPWIYGACVGTEGRLMIVRPGHSPCLRCIFPNPPRADDLPTCDTRGVLGPAAAVTASLQAIAAIKVLTANTSAVRNELLSIDTWSNRFQSIDLESARDPECLCCGQRQFEFLSRPPSDAAITLCGRNAVQVRGEKLIELRGFARRWRALGEVEQNPFFVRCRLVEPADLRLTLFSDGRLIVHGTTDAGRAKSVYARFVGA